MASIKTHEVDVLVIGSGLSGLATALKLPAHLQIAVISKSTLPSGNTWLAQGGIAATMATDDSVDLHIRDTLIAGAGLCRETAVREIVTQGAERIQDLIDWGVQFDISHDLNSTEWDLTKEGGHSVRRILHVEDHTGEAIHAQLLKEVQKRPGLLLLEHHFAIELILTDDIRPLEIGPRSCLGAYLLDRKNSSVTAILAKATVLATGGAGKTYLYTSNWSGATGDGIALAYRAGARIANMEFMQFHPTCLYHPQARNFLLTEALRGEGGQLVNSEGQRFMLSQHPDAELAPRDVVARSIDQELKRSGEDCVYLDLRHKPEGFVRERFPMIYNRCLKLGIDMAKDLVPVVPAAHYLCGGVLTDTSGKTDIPGLFAMGETACTGLHGANRLASNSLLECLVMAHNAASKITECVRNYQDSELYRLMSEARNPLHLKNFAQESKQDPDELILVSHLWDEIRRLMWNYVGIVRTDRRLARALHRLNNLIEELEAFYSQYRLHPDVIELRNLATVAQISVQCALNRKESRGIHYNLDYPFSNSDLPPRDTILRA